MLHRGGRGPERRRGYAGAEYHEPAEHVGDPDHHGGIFGAPHRADRGMDRHVRGALHTGNLVSDSAVPGKMAGGMKWFCSFFEQNPIKRRCVFLNFHFS